MVTWGGSNAFGQSGYSQNLGGSYSGSSVGGPDGGSQMSMAARHSAILGGSQEGEVGGYRGLASAAARYGGQYGSLYGSAGLSSGQQPSVPNAKSSGLSALDGRGAYSSTLQDSPKFASADYLSAPTHSYSHRTDQLYSEKIPDYPTIERRQYGEQRPSSYMGRDVPSEATGLYGDSVSFRHQHQPDLYDRVEQSILQRQEQLLKAQSAALDAGLRQPDYLTAKVASGRHPTQDLLSYADPRSLSMLSSVSYSGQHAQSILGAAPRRSVDDLMYQPASSNPGYGVSLPPGREYGTKTLHVSSPDPEYPGSVHGGHPRIDELKDDRAAYLREFEIREDERRRERLRERERDRDRDREKERERERLRERERERDRDRERLRILERREKERAIEKERKRALEIKREKSSPRALRDHRGSSSTREGRPLRRESPRRETSHRRHSPAKEKRREYVCKVYSFNLVDAQRDYLSLDKRYPRLFVSPEFTKVIVNWPRENLKLSIHTPVSFEHDFVEGDHSTQSKELSSKLLSEDLVVAGEDRTVWNAKILLMSGISKSALEDLSSEKVSDERMTHICSILRFGILKKDHTFMTIGGPWSPMDGGDPSQDSSSLVRTALRHAKDMINLDLKRCQNWNQFLEIHYDRFDKDGCFSHKEVTVLFVPDLSDCLPSLDAWRAQWLAHKKVIAEREKQLSLKKEKSKEKEDRQKDKGKDKPNDAEKGKLEKKKDATSSGKVTAGVKEKAEKKKESTPSGQVTADIKEKVEKKKESASSGQVTADVTEKAGHQSKVDLPEQKNDGDVSKDGNEALEGGVSIEKKDQKEATGSTKTVKKKIIKRVVKQKVANKLSGDGISASNQADTTKESPGYTKPETSTQLEDSPADPVAVKTFARKKPVAKGVAGNADHQADGVAPVEENKEKEVESTENNVGEPKVNTDVSATPSAQNAPSKTTVKRKVIKRVPKKKVAVAQASEENGNKEKEDVDKAKVGKAETEQAGKGAILEEKQNATDSIKSLIKDTMEAKKDEKVSNPESASASKKGTKKDNPDSKASKKGKPKDVKETKDSKDDSKSNSSKELKEKRKTEDSPPRHPGFILQTKWNKDSKLRSLSLSLDSLLEYTDKDIDESTFELSLFAEILYEMLQYQMGSRLMAFLQKLRVQFVAKRNKRKREKEEAAEKEKERSPAKRMKAIELPVKNESASSGVNVVKEDDKKARVEDEGTGNDVGEPKMKEHISEDNVGEETEEDPEEDPEECEEMEEETSQQALSSQENKEEKEELQKSEDNAAALQEEAGNEKVGNENVKDEVMTEATEAKPAAEEHLLEPKDEKVDAVKKEHVVDKELLQAFRFFDRNRVGYIRVEDLRLILHSLGKCASHRDVKELVQSALLESNTGRDDRILYNKLVTMSGL